MHDAVDRTSAPAESPRTQLSPEAIAPRMSARCEIDLSPGIVMAPSNLRALRTVAINFHLQARRVEAWSRRRPIADVRRVPPRTARSAAGRLPPGGGAASRARR